jgi:hypothetical protein
MPFGAGFPAPGRHRRIRPSAAAGRAAASGPAGRAATGQSGRSCGAWGACKIGCNTGARGQRVTVMPRCRAKRRTAARTGLGTRNEIKASLRPRLAKGRGESGSVGEASSARHRAPQSSPRVWVTGWVGQGLATQAAAILCILAVHRRTSFPPLPAPTVADATAEYWRFLTSWRVAISYRCSRVIKGN